jgi:hypothetical protein
MGIVGYTGKVIFARTLTYMLLSVPLVFVAGFIGVSLGYLGAFVVTTPAMCMGLGKGAPRRLWRSVRWILAPLLTAMVAGALIAQVNLPYAERAILAGTLVSLVYGTAAWLSAPGWLGAKARLQIDARLKWPHWRAAGVPK